MHFLISGTITDGRVNSQEPAIVTPFEVPVFADTEEEAKTIALDLLNTQANLSVGVVDGLHTVTRIKNYRGPGAIRSIAITKTTGYSKPAPAAPAPAAETKPKSKAPAESAGTDAQS